MSATTFADDDDRTPSKTVFPLTAFPKVETVHAWLKAAGYNRTDYQLTRQTNGALIAFDPDSDTPPSGIFDIEIQDGALIHFEPRAAASVGVATKGDVTKVDFSFSGNAYPSAPGTAEPTEVKRIAKLPADVRKLAQVHYLSAHNAEALAVVMTASHPIPADHISSAALVHLHAVGLIQERANGAMGRRTVEPGPAAKPARTTATKIDTPDLVQLAARPRPPVAAKSDAAPAPISRGLLGGLLGTRGN